jgi:hypothetical protein
MPNEPNIAMTMPLDFMRSVLLRDGRWYSGEELRISEDGIGLAGYPDEIDVPWTEVVGVSAVPMQTPPGGPIAKALSAVAEHVDATIAVHMGKVTSRKRLTFSDGRTATVEEMEVEA